jgi:hypothetical protein
MANVFRSIYWSKMEYTEVSIALPVVLADHARKIQSPTQAHSLSEQELGRYQISE